MIHKHCSDRANALLIHSTRDKNPVATVPPPSEFSLLFPDPLGRLDGLLCPWEYHGFQEVDEMIANDGIEKMASPHLFHTFFICLLDFSLLSLLTSPTFSNLLKNLL